VRPQFFGFSLISQKWEVIVYEITNFGQIKVLERSEVKNDIRAPNNSGEVHSLGKSAIKKGSIFSKGIPFKPDNLRDRKRKLSYI